MQFWLAGFWKDPCLYMKTFKHVFSIGRWSALGTRTRVNEALDWQTTPVEFGRDVMASEAAENRDGIRWWCNRQKSARARWVDGLYMHVQLFIHTSRSLFTLMHVKCCLLCLVQVMKILFWFWGHCLDFSIFFYKALMYDRTEIPSDQQGFQES